MCQSVTMIYTINLVASRLKKCFTKRRFGYWNGPHTSGAGVRWGGQVMDNCDLIIPHTAHSRGWYRNDTRIALNYWRAEFFSENMNIYLHFLSLLDPRPALVIATFSHLRHGSVCPTWSDCWWTDHARPLQWRHNERDGATNHQPDDCLLNCLFKTQIKENIKAPRHWPLWGEFNADWWIPRTKGQ